MLASAKGVRVLFCCPFNWRCIISAQATARRPLTCAHAQNHSSDVIRLAGLGQILFECDVVFVNHGATDEPDFEVYIGGHRQWKAETFGLAKYEDPKTNFFVISREKLAAVRCARGLPVQTLSEYILGLACLEQEIELLLEIKHHRGGMPVECAAKIAACIDVATNVSVTIISFNRPYLKVFSDKGFSVGVMLRSIPLIEELKAMIRELNVRLLLVDRFVESEQLRHEARVAEVDTRGERYMHFGVFTVNDAELLPFYLSEEGGVFPYNFVITDSEQVMRTCGDLASDP